MGIVSLMFLTSFVAVICGAVILIQVGGWLPILAAIFIILYYFLSAILIVIFLAANIQSKKEKKGEKYEGMGN